MTVCIAGLADNKKAVVMASDNMITANMPPIEFEHKELPKIVKIYSNFYVLIAGTVNVAMDIIDLIRSEVEETLGCTDKFRLVQNIYRKYRMERIEKSVLNSQGFLSIKDFFSLQSQLKPEIVLGVQNAIGMFNLGVDMILVATDKNECHIKVLTHPGNLDNPLEYAVIGFGQLQAMQSLIGSQYNQNEGIGVATYLVFEAKKRAEVTPSVGEMTDMTVISLTNDGKTKEKILDDADIVKLNEIYKEVNLRNTDVIKQKLKDKKFVI